MCLKCLVIVPLSILFLSQVKDIPCERKDLFHFWNEKKLTYKKMSSISSSECVPQDVPNTTTLLSNTLWPKLNFHVHNRFVVIIFLW
jgi:hypothetical protein